MRGFGGEGNKNLHKAATAECATGETVRPEELWRDVFFSQYSVTHRSEPPVVGAALSFAGTADNSRKPNWSHLWVNGSFRASTEMLPSLVKTWGTRVCCVSSCLHWSSWSENISKSLQFPFFSFLILFYFFTITSTTFMPLLACHACCVTHKTPTRAWWKSWRGYKCEQCCMWHQLVS